MDVTSVWAIRLWMMGVMGVARRGLFSVSCGLC